MTPVRNMGETSGTMIGLEQVVASAWVKAPDTKLI
jgi:hypothetical protein